MYKRMTKKTKSNLRGFSLRKKLVCPKRWMGRRRWMEKKWTTSAKDPKLALSLRNRKPLIAKLEGPHIQRAGRHGGKGYS